MVLLLLGFFGFFVWVFCVGFLCAVFLVGFFLGGWVVCGLFFFCFFWGGFRILLNNVICGIVLRLSPLISNM